MTDSANLSQSHWSQIEPREPVCILISMSEITKRQFVRVPDDTKWTCFKQYATKFNVQRHISSKHQLYATLQYCISCRLYPGKGIWASIVRYSCTAAENNTITDICDGSLYKKVVTLDDRSVSLIFNSDGIQLYKSSATNLWPLFATINELPPSIRYVTWRGCVHACVCACVSVCVWSCVFAITLFELLEHSRCDLLYRFLRMNTILCGLWQGQGKPPMTSFLKLFVEQINALKREGYNLYYRAIV